ncbi:MAG: M28 family peptidase [Syntrophaceae bacterium]|nr:M28 family peptidase [Syntrophaceae bacterium]
MFIIPVLTTSRKKIRHLLYPDPDIKIEDLKETVRYLSKLNPPRNYYHQNSMKMSARYISKKFEEYGLEPKDQPFMVGNNVYTNVLANAGPVKCSRLIVGAHYDVCGEQPGADDNASAVAGLLEIARFAKRHETELPYRVDFVAYALEEPPFFATKYMGSYVHAKLLKKSRVSVKGMICLEMIGFFTEKKNSQSYPLPFMRFFYPSTGHFIGIVSNYSSSSLATQIAKHMSVASVDVRTLRAPSLVLGIDFSDHRNYWKFGYDAVMLTDTAFYRNPHYHQRTDTIGTLDFDKMREVVKGVCWSILNMK